MSISSFRSNKTIPSDTFDEGLFDSINSSLNDTSIRRSKNPQKHIEIHDHFKDLNVQYELNNLAHKNPSLERTMHDLIQNYKTKKVEEIKYYLEDLGFSKPSQRVFDLLAHDKISILLDIIENYDLTPVNLAYALRSLEYSKNPDKRAYRIIANALKNSKGYVREGAAYGMLAFSSTFLAEDAKNLLEAAIREEKFESVKKVLILSRNILAH